MSELDEFKKVVTPIAYGLALKTETGTTEYQQLYAEVDVVKYFENKPQLTIPQSIAEELLDEDGGVNYTSYVLMVWDEGDWSDKLQKWMENTDKWWFIVDAYLAGKALGVDLVKVVEG